MAADLVSDVCSSLFFVHECIKYYSLTKLLVVKLLSCIASLILVYLLFLQNAQQQEFWATRAYELEKSTENPFGNFLHQTFRQIY